MCIEIRSSNLANRTIFMMLLPYMYVHMDFIIALVYLFSVVDIGFVVPTYTVDECESCPVTLVIGMSGSSLARNVTFTLSTQDDTALG